MVTTNQDPGALGGFQLEDDGHTLFLGDCRDMLAGLDENSVDGCVTDPPYGLSKVPDMAEVLRHWLAGDDYEASGGGFMGKSWDSFVPGPATWRELYRVLKPGAHAVVFAGQRTVDLMGVALRLAGFEVRDLIGWQFYSGFPKSLDVSKAIDALRGAEREVVGVGAARCADLEAGRPCSHGTRNENSQSGGTVHTLATAPATPDAERWSGFGTAIKPAIEPALLVRKPISESSIARNVLRWGTGALNIDACRYAFGDDAWPGPQERWDGRERVITGRSDYGRFAWDELDHVEMPVNDLGRFPANVYACPKTSTAERELGCEGLSMRKRDESRREGDPGGENPRNRGAEPRGNHHPTVKPLRLIRWLMRLVTPPGGTVVEPFCGSGTGLLAAQAEGFRCIAAEMESEYHEVIRARYAGWARIGWPDEIPGDVKRESKSRDGRVQSTIWEAMA